MRKLTAAGTLALTLLAGSQPARAWDSKVCTTPSAGVPGAWRQPAAEIVSAFEMGGAQGWGSVIGDFDCQGASAGLMQWNFGKGSLHGRLRAIREADQTAYDSALGDFAFPLWAAISADHASGASTQALDYVRRLQRYDDEASCTAVKRGARWTPQGIDFRDRLSALMASPPGIDAQQARIFQHQDIAWGYATWWASTNPQRVGQPLTLREFVFFADTLTFHGCSFYNSIAYDRVAAFKAKHGSGALKVIVDYLKSHPDVEQVQREEALKNATLWAGKTPTATELDLLIVGYLIATSIKAAPASSQFRFNTIGRRGAVALNDGWVNGRRQSFPALK